MKKEKWLKLMVEEELPIEVIYEFYQDHNGLVKNINEFTKIFIQATFMGIITYESAIHRIYKYYNDKFEINK